MFKRVLFSFIFVSTALFSKTVYWLGPYWGTAADVPGALWNKMKDSFEKCGLKLTALSGAEIQRDLMRYRRIFSSSQTSYVVIENTSYVDNMQIFYAAVPHKKRVLVPWEPPTFSAGMYTKVVLGKFAKVLTWDNSLVDNQRFFKIYHTVYNPMIKNTVPFKDKKFSCMIFACKSSIYPLQLYSLRWKVINFFKFRPESFDLYGGWPSETPNFLGSVESKTETIKNYKFSFAMENTRDISGYMTEKIWDVFRAGAIPIYWGDSDIQKEIPSDCYVDFRKYANMDDLLEYLQSITEDEYNRRIESIKAFLDSAVPKKYTDSNFAQTVAEILSK